MPSAEDEEAAWRVEQWNQGHRPIPPRHRTGTLRTNPAPAPRRRVLSRLSVRGLRMTAPGSMQSDFWEGRKRMAVVIHRDPHLQKCLTKLRRAGGRALLAAEQVETILARLASHVGRHPDAVHKRTRHGEARIDKCRKFDLVGGYRLVYLHEGQQYYFLFAGTHDDCDRWLTHHRDLTLALPEAPTPAGTIPMAETPAAAPAISPDDLEPGDLDYDAIILKDIDEKILRRVFRGLCEP